MNFLNEIKQANTPFTFVGFKLFLRDVEYVTFVLVATPYFMYNPNKHDSKLVSSVD